jgi:predicted nucleic acid-binding protein
MAGRDSTGSPSSFCREPSRPLAAAPTAQRRVLEAENARAAASLNVYLVPDTQDAHAHAHALAALLMLIVDAGPLYAAAARRDRNHQRSIELLGSAPRPLLVPALVVTEVAYLLGDRIGPHAELAFARSLERGELLVEPVLDSDWPRIAELNQEVPLGIVDASVVARAERRGLDAIATLDHRHLATVKPRHIDAFTLVP